MADEAPDPNRSALNGRHDTDRLMGFKRFAGDRVMPGAISREQSGGMKSSWSSTWRSVRTGEQSGPGVQPFTPRQQRPRILKGNLGTLASTEGERDIRNASGAVTG